MIRDLTIFILPLPQGEGWGKVAFGKVHQLFGDKLNAIIEELNETLAA